MTEQPVDPPVEPFAEPITPSGPPDSLIALEDLGYRVVLSQNFGDFDVYWVEGFGLGVYTRSNDEEHHQDILNEHTERLQQHDETGEETQARWVREGKVPAPYPLEEL